MNKKLHEINAVINNHKFFLITSHMDPDGDSLGSLMAMYYSLVDRGKKVCIMNQGAIPEKYRFMNPDNLIINSAGKLPFEPEVIIVLECPSLDRIGFVRDLIPKSAFMINLDHHNDNENYANINLIDSDSSAVAEVLFFLFEEDRVTITPDIAKLLYAAISADTGRFRFGSTTSRCMNVASKLIEKGANPKEISDHLYSGILPNTMQLLGITLSSLKITSDGLIGYFIIKNDDVSKSGADLRNSEGFVDFILSVSGVQLGFLFKELSGDEVKISVRSQNGYDSALFASKFSGGGHTNAAGFSRKGQIDKVVNEVIENAQEFVSAIN